MENQIAKYLVEEGKNRRNSTIVRASSVGMCKRRVAYDLLGYEGSPEAAHSRVTLDIGEALHITVQKYLANLGIVSAKLVIKDGELTWENRGNSGFEIPFRDEENRIVGRCDGISVPLRKDKKTGELVPDPKGEQYLIEIKSITDRPSFFVLGILDGGKDPINEQENKPTYIDITPTKSSNKKLQQLLYNFQHSRKVVGPYGTRDCPVYKLKVNGKDQLVTVVMASNMLGKFSNLKAPLPQHIQQASIYADYFGLKKILFIYIAKDGNPFLYEDSENMLNIPIKVLEYSVNTTEVELIKMGIKELYTYVDTNQLPPREYLPDSTECRFCPFRKTCYA